MGKRTVLRQWHNINNWMIGSQWRFTRSSQDLTFDLIFSFVLLSISSAIFLYSASLHFFQSVTLRYRQLSSFLVTLRTVWRKLNSNCLAVMAEIVFKVSLNSLPLLVSRDLDIMSNLSHLQVDLVNIGGTDIVDGNHKLTLGLIWSIILHWQVGT